MNNLILGSWGLSGKSFVGGRPTGYGKVSYKSFSAVLTAAHAAGIRQIDTAPNYGNSNGYHRIKKWQNETGNCFNLIVKAGRIVKAGNVVSYRDVDEFISQSELIINDFDTVTHLFIKDPPIEFIRNGLLFDQLLTIKSYYPQLKLGFSTHLNQALNDLPSVAIDEYVIELEYNAINSPVMENILLSLRLKGWEIWGMQPLAYGFLSGRYHSESQFEPEDWRSNLSKSAVLKYCILSEAFQKSFLPNHPISNAVRAALFCILNPSLKKVIIGPKNVVQLNDYLRANQLADMEKNCYAYNEFINNRIS